MKVIGFSTKYYTLWEIYSEEITGRDGRKGKKVTATYLKNISTDLETAKVHHPEATVDLSVHGTHSWNRTVWEPLPTDVFHNGKYKGQPIAECPDLEYLFWAYGSLLSGEEQISIARETLLASGHYAIYKDSLMRAEEASRLEAEDDAVQEMCDILEGGGTITVDASSVHVDEGTEDLRLVSYALDGRIVLIWPRDLLVEREYMGRQYWVPGKNGKGIRTKNRQIDISAEKSIVLDQNWRSNRLEVTVKDFSVVSQKKIG